MTPKISYPELDVFNLSSFEAKIRRFCDHRDMNIIRDKILRQSFFDFIFAVQEEFYHPAF
jgi:hypothetical protein